MRPLLFRWVGILWGQHLLLLSRLRGCMTLRVAMQRAVTNLVRQPGLRRW
jgi:hypothetical protein